MRMNKSLFLVFIYYLVYLYLLSAHRQLDGKGAAFSFM